MSSKKPFPFEKKNIPISDHAAEEARLYFVAMTRAKNKLYMSWEARENHWYSGQNYSPKKNSQQFLLKGEPDEFFVSWPGRDFELQKFIENNVNVHNKVIIRDGELLYDSTAITKLKQANIGKVNKKGVFRVSNVMRYNCGEYFRRNNAKYYDRLCKQVKDRGWFYLPLIEQL